MSNFQQSRRTDFLSWTKAHLLQWPARAAIVVASCGLLLALSISAWLWYVDESEKANAASLTFVEPKRELPKAGVVRLSHSFGIVRPPIKCVHSFKVENTGTEVWTISGIHSSCSCTVPRISAKSIAPGSFILVEVSYHPPSADGVDTRPVQLRFAESNAPLVVLEVSAEVRNPLSLSLGNLDLGEASRASEPQRSFEVLNYSDRAWDKVKVVSNVGWLATDIALAAHAPSDQNRLQTWTVTVKANTGTLASGKHDALLTICSDDPALQTKTLPVTMKVTSPLMAIPDQLFYGEIAPNIPAASRILLRFAPGCVPERREEITVSHNLGKEFEVKCEPGATDCWVLTATLNVESSAAQAREFIHGRLTLQFHNEKLPNVNIPISAKIKGK